MHRTTGLEAEILRKFVQVGDYTTTEQVKPIADFLVNGYLSKEFDKVVVFSSHFKSALKQEPLIMEILPITVDSIKETIKGIVPQTGKFSEFKVMIQEEKRSKQYTIEPSPKLVLESLAEHLVFMQIYHLILEANASEHSARRMAMKTASDNAKDLGENLNLQYNKSRQAAITSQIIEIISGAEALN